MCWQTVDAEVKEMHRPDQQKRTQKFKTNGLNGEEAI
jgi:hypothetical protein